MFSNNKYTYRALPNSNTKRDRESGLAKQWLFLFPPNVPDVCRSCLQGQSPPAEPCPFLCTVATHGTFPRSPCRSESLRDLTGPSSLSSSVYDALLLKQHHLRIIEMTPLFFAMHTIFFLVFRPSLPPPLLPPPLASAQNSPPVPSSL